MKRLYSLLITAALTTSASMLVATDAKRDKTPDKEVSDGDGQQPVTAVEGEKLTPRRTDRLQDGNAPQRLHKKSSEEALDGSGSRHSTPKVSPRKLDMGGGDEEVIELRRRPEVAGVLHQLISDAVAKTLAGRVGLMEEESLVEALSNLSVQSSSRASGGDNVSAMQRTATSASDDEGAVEEDEEVKDMLMADVDETLKDFIAKVVDEMLSDWNRGRVASLHIEELQHMIEQAVVQALKGKKKEGSLVPVVRRSKFVRGFIDGGRWLVKAPGNAYNLIPLEFRCALAMLVAMYLMQNYENELVSVVHRY